MAQGLLTGLTDFLFGSVDNSQYLQAFAQEQLAAEQARRREQEAYAKQQAFSQYLTSVLNGTAPSMAQMQLSQGLQQQMNAQQSMAAGVAGPGNALARYGAAVNYGNAAANTNQSAALARVAEQDAARRLYGQNALGMEAASANMYGQASKNALGYAGVASGQGIDQFNQANSNQQAGAILQGLGQAGAAYFGGRSK